MASELFKIKFTFINAKGIEKNVVVYVDRGTKNILPKLDDKSRHDYLIELYHDQEKEKNYRRKTITFSDFIKNEEDYYDPMDDNYNLEKIVYQNKLIKDILESLNEKDRQLIIMFYLKGLKIYQIADILDVTEKTVSSNLRRILKDLRDKFIH